MENLNYYSTPTGGTTINYVSNCTEELNANITNNETRDRYIATRMIYDSVKEGVSNITITPTDLYCPVDLNCSCIVPHPEYNTISASLFDVEIKERFKDEETLKKYPDVELRISKYNRMKRQSKGRQLFYFVLLNEKIGYIFNLTDGIDKLKDVKTFKWRIKKTQLDPNSEYVEEPTYLIPVENAIRTIDISKYYTDYYNANYSKD